MRFKLDIDLLDPNGIVIEGKTFEGVTAPLNDDPGDPSVYEAVADYVGRFAAAMACEGMAFTVRATPRCTFPGCDGPADIGGLCMADAEATV